MIDFTGRNAIEMTSDKGVKVVSALRDHEAAHILGDLTSDFAKSLASDFKRFGAWSINKRVWAHKLALEAITTKAPRVSAPIINMAGIMNLFAKAKRSGLAFPKIRFALSGGVRLVLSIAGDRSNKPGTVNVSNGGKYGEPDNIWYGRIDPTTGQYLPSQRSTPEIAEFLRSFADDPAGVAANYGKLTGHCCFCNKALTRGKGTGPRCKALYATDVGYGKDCAKKYDLPFGLAAALAVEGEMALEDHLVTEANASIL